MTWDVQKHGGQTVLYSSDGNSGIDIRINKGRRSLEIGGRYDTCVGIESTEISIDELLEYFKKK